MRNFFRELGRHARSSLPDLPAQEMMEAALRCALRVSARIARFVARSRAAGSATSGGVLRRNMIFGDAREPSSL
jgi:hypothetical protein